MNSFKCKTKYYEKQLTTFSIWLYKNPNTECMVKICEYANLLAKNITLLYKGTNTVVAINCEDLPYEYPILDY